MTTITAVTNIICYLIGGVVLIIVAGNQNKVAYRPSRTLRGVLLVAGATMFGLAGGYALLLLRWGNLKAIQYFWLSPLLSILSITFAGTAVYLFRQGRAYEEMRADFIQTAAHELRTPLTIIWGFADILTTQYDNIERGALQTYLGMIHRQTAILGGHIQDILAFEKGRHNDLLPTEAVDLAFLLHERVETIREAIAKPAGVVIAVDQLMPVMVMGHTDKIRLIISNLLVNAVKFSPPDRTGGTVEVGLYAIGDTAVIAIRDTGVGISPAFMPLLFEPFQQERRDVRRPFAGMGMGFAAAASLVKSQGGRITSESELGQGSTFRVILPLGERP